MIQTPTKGCVCIILGIIINKIVDKISNKIKFLSILLLEVSYICIKQQPMVSNIWFKFAFCVFVSYNPCSMSRVTHWRQVTALLITVEVEFFFDLLHFWRFIYQKNPFHLNFKVRKFTC